MYEEVRKKRLAAIEAAKKACNENENDSKTWRDWAAALLFIVGFAETKEENILYLKDVIKKLEKAVEVNEGDLDAWWELGEALMYIPRVDHGFTAYPDRHLNLLYKALACFTRVRKIDPKYCQESRMPDSALKAIDLLNYLEAASQEVPEAEFTKLDEMPEEIDEMPEEVDTTQTSSNGEKFGSFDWKHEYYQKRLMELVHPTNEVETGVDLGVDDVEDYSMEGGLLVDLEGDFEYNPELEGGDVTSPLKDKVEVIVPLCEDGEQGRARLVEDLEGVGNEKGLTGLLNAADGAEQAFKLLLPKLSEEVEVLRAKGAVKLLQQSSKQLLRSFVRNYVMQTSLETELTRCYDESDDLKGQIEKLKSMLGGFDALKSQNVQLKAKLNDVEVELSVACLEGDTLRKELGESRKNVVQLVGTNKTLAAEFSRFKVDTSTKQVEKVNNAFKAGYVKALINAKVPKVDSSWKMCRFPFPSPTAVSGESRSQSSSVVAHMKPQSSSIDAFSKPPIATPDEEKY